MAYLRTYRGEFENTLPGADNAAVSQIVRIDINEGSGVDAPASLTGVFSGGAATLLYPPLADMSPDYATRLALFNQWAAFFYIGMTVGITGTSADGDYVVIGVSLNPPLPPPAIATPGSITITTSIPTASETFEDGVTYTDNTAGAIIPINLTGDPLHISTIDNDEDKFTPIRAKQATIEIYTGGDIDIDTFCNGDDSSFYVEIFVDDLIIFKGFLIIPDMQQEFMPDPNVLILKAVDNLGVLKEQELKDFENVTPKDNWRIMDYIAWSLNKTGLQLPINVINTIKHGSGSFSGSVAFSGNAITMANSLSEHFYIGGTFTISGSASNNVTFTVTALGQGLLFAILGASVTFTTEGPVAVTFQDESSLLNIYDACYLEATTFETAIDVRENCYSVLTKILKMDSVLFQMNGEWWILRIDDIQNPGVDYSVDRFDNEGVFIETVSILRDKGIGMPDTEGNMCWMNDNCVIIPDRPYLKIILTYKYQFAIEFVCNTDLTRGEYLADLPDETLDSKGDPPDGDDSFVYTVKSYTPDCWEYKKGAPELPQDSESYIKKYTYNDYEKFAWLYAPEAATNSIYYWQSQKLVRMNAGDKFEVSIDVRYGDDFGTPGAFTFTQMVVKLYADDGTTWSLASETGSNSTNPFPEWTQSDFDVSLETMRWIDTTASVDLTQWSTITFKSAPLPRSGKIQIELWNNFDADAHNKSWDNLRMDYFPLINGSYKKYTGQQWSVEQGVNNKAVRDEEVNISDAPSAAFKGALKIFNGTEYVSSYLFTSANHTTPITFGEMQAWSVWNQYRISNRNFSGEIDGMESYEVDDTNYNGADLIHKYVLTDVNKNTINRLFMMLHYDMDFNLLEIKNAYVASLYNTLTGKNYEDEKNFKYITE